MNENIQDNQKNMNQETPVVDSKKSFVSRILDKIPIKIKERVAYVYANKIVRWFIIGFLGFLVVILLLVTIIGGSRKESDYKVALPTPEVQVLPTVAPDDIVTSVQNTLLNLKTQILLLDVKQSRLTPPTINYDIRF